MSVGQEARVLNVDALDSDPIPEKVDLAPILDEVTRFLDRFVAFPSQQALHATTLWAVHAHAIDAFESTPRLALLSPEKGSGKTRTLEVLDLIVPGAMHAANLSAPAIFRRVASDRPTLLMDECDSYLGPRTAREHEELRGLINAGHRRGAVAYRCVGEPSKMEVHEFPAFAAVALAGLGDLPDTIIDRSIVVKMRRRAPSEVVESFRIRKVTPEGHALRDRMQAWAVSNLDVLRDAEPEMPQGIVDRPADVWEPLLAIADLAGPDWAERARVACVALNRERREADPSLGVQLLQDVRTVFGDGHKLSTETLIGRLCDLDESPWGDLRGRALDARGLARRLRPFGPRPKKVRIGETSLQGYERGDFYDAWVRYLPPSAEGAEHAEHEEPPNSDGPDPVPPDHSVPEHRSQTERPEAQESVDVPSVPDVPLSGPREPERPLTVAEIADVFEAEVGVAQ